MKGDDPFADYPQIRTFFETMSEAEDRFSKDCDAIGKCNKSVRGAAILNAAIKFWFDVATAANVAAGMEASAAKLKAKRTVRKKLHSAWQVSPWSPAERRAITVSILYRHDIRLAESGAKNSRMEAALQAAASIEGLAGKDPIGTIKKSNARLRKQMRGKVLWRLNLRQLRIETVDAEAFLFANLPSRPGRPQKP